jgi:mono/diheme cytochrome c family protein
MKKRRLVLKAAILVVVVVAGILIFALLPTATANLKPAADGTGAAQALIDSGHYVALASDCIACHTATGGKPFAGGLPIASPIGTIYSSNITPDKIHGIGTYSLNDFDRAVRHGITPDGTTLYPAMPYPSYARMSDDDLRALYAYFMYGVAPGCGSKSRQRYSLAAFTALATGDLAQSICSGSRTDTTGSLSGCRDCAWCLSGTKSGALWKLPHAARSDIAGIVAG